MQGYVGVDDQVMRSRGTELMCRGLTLIIKRAATPVQMRSAVECRVRSRQWEREPRAEAMCHGEYSLTLII
jgi:hypothetical protein